MQNGLISMRARDRRANDDVVIVVVVVVIAKLGD